MAHDDERYFGYLVTDSARLLRTVFDRRVRGLGLTRSQCMVLSRLKRNPGMSQSEVAEILEVEKATAGRIIDRLEEKGWIERRADSKDRRINRLHLTARADELHATFWPLAENIVTDALADLTKDEQRHLADMLLRVKARLQGMAERTPSNGNGNGNGNGKHALSRVTVNGAAEEELSRALDEPALQDEASAL